MLRVFLAAVIQFEHPENEQVLLSLIDLVNEMSDDNPELKRILAIWIRGVVLRRSKGTLLLPKVQDLKELKMTLAERFDSPERQRQRGRCQLRGGGFGLRCFRCKATAGLSYPQNLWITRREGGLDGTYFGEIGALLKQ